MNTCTCDLEPAFFVDPESGPKYRAPWDVVDCEGTIVAQCDDEARAYLIAASLNAFTVDARACVVHRTPVKRS